MTPMSRRKAIKLMAAGGLAFSLQPKFFVLASEYPTDLNEFENDFATAAFAIDLMWGGNINDPTGLSHVIVDAYTSGKKQPDLGPPNLMQLFLQQGDGVRDEEAIKSFIKHNNLEARFERVVDYANGLKDIWRRSYLLNSITVLKVHLNLRKSLAGLIKPVDPETCYLAAFGRAPYFIDASEKREILRQRLSAVKVETTTSMSLAEAVEKWSQKRLLDAKGLEKNWPLFNREMIQRTRERIFPYLPKYVTTIPENIVDFGIVWENVNFSGLNLAKHTIDKNGNPVYHTVVRMSSQVTKAEADYKLNLVAHEGWPGHGLHLPLTHLLYSKKMYGFETTCFILNSPAGFLAEGIASATSYLLYGQDVKSHLSPDELVAVAFADLAVAGRNNVTVKFIQGEQNPDKLVQFLYHEHALPLKDASRYCRWLSHPLFGIMYLPAYGIGAEMIHQAVRTYGREKVIPVAYGTQGQIDGISFPECMTRFAAQAV